eukprot:4849744-Prymnesium_polylepis.1
MPGKHLGAGTWRKALSARRNLAPTMPSWIRKLFHRLHEGCPLHAEGQSAHLVLPDALAGFALHFAKSLGRWAHSVLRGQCRLGHRTTHTCEDGQRLEGLGARQEDAGRANG